MQPNPAVAAAYPELLDWTGDRVHSLMPPRADVWAWIRASFGMDGNGRDPDKRAWYSVIESWWLGEERGSLIERLEPAPGIDRDAALRHLHAVICCSLKHEYKIAAAAALASTWFKRPAAWPDAFDYRPG